jgi:hypothetical protein
MDEESRDRDLSLSTRIITSSIVTTGVEYYNVGDQLQVAPAQHMNKTPKELPVPRLSRIHFLFLTATQPLVSLSPNADIQTKGALMS